MLKAIREQAIGLLPIGQSFIPYDIIITVIVASTNGHNVSVKTLFKSMPYSDMGLRYHFRKLISDGWLQLVPSTVDKRVKEVHPSEKLLTNFESLSSKLAKWGSSQDIQIYS